jgi:hypothetical protein
VLAGSWCGEATEHNRANQLHHEVEKLTRSTERLTAWPMVVRIDDGDGDRRRRRWSWRGRSRGSRSDSLHGLSKKTMAMSMASTVWLGDAPDGGEKRWPAQLGLGFPENCNRERGN